MDDTEKRVREKFVKEAQNLIEEARRTPGVCAGIGRARTCWFPEGCNDLCVVPWDLYGFAAHHQSRFYLVWRTKKGVLDRQCLLVGGWKEEHRVHSLEVVEGELILTTTTSNNRRKRVRIKLNELNPTS